ncbi:MAG TPA: DNA-protecting protein DprA [Firmicutes bacterium]|nr:DNA-protecting protein DprA [Bacillota bacterium]
MVWSEESGGATDRVQQAGLSWEEKAARVALAAVPGLRVEDYRWLLSQFGGIREALAAGPARWRAQGPPGTAERLARTGWRVRQAAPGVTGHNGAVLLRWAEDLGWTVVTLGERAYPPLLTQIPSPPLVLYSRGHLAEEDEPAVAVVGTRRATAYGLYHAERLAAELADMGLTVVSGLARGIDAAAHRGALAGGGRTLAVLGCGPDRVYPPEHKSLAEEIVSHGALLTEFPPGTVPAPSNFPRRNRVIAGLARATVVVEAGSHSGALNTAKHALHAGRVVCIVPGDVGRPGSAGPLKLLREGAVPVESGSHVREALGNLADPDLRFGPEWRVGPIRGIDWRRKPSGEEGRAEEADATRRWEILRRALRGGPARPEEVARRAGLPVGEVAAQLVLGELEGKVRSYADGRLSLAPERRRRAGGSEGSAV